MKRAVLWVAVAVMMAATSAAYGQCRGGGGGAPSAARGTTAMASGSIGSVGSVGASVNPYAQAFSSVGALQQQLARQQYQKALKDQQNRAQRQALRQYWANQRRQEKGATSPGALGAASNSSSSFASLDFSPGR